MAQHKVRFEQFFAAPRDRVFGYFAALETFSRLWPGRMRRIRDSADAAHADGLGSVREVSGSGMTFEETITAFEPPQRIEYRVTKGSPIKNHVGRLVFTAVDGGTRLDYTIEFDPKVPLTGGLIASLLCASFKPQRAVEDLARSA